MLQEMRKYTRSWVASTFLGALALSFALWGVADIFRGRTDTSAYTIGSTVVPIEAFQRDYRNQASRAGVALSPEEQKLLGQQVLERMTDVTALDNLAGDLGLTTSDARVRAVIQSTPQFNGALGAFDRETFLQAINRAGFGEKEFVELVRGDSTRDQLLTAVQGGFVMPGAYARAIYSFVNETRAVEYVVLTDAAAGTVAPPPDSELQGYVKAHPEKFSTPEYRSVDMATISADELAPTIAVTDKDIAKEIADHRSDYIVDEKREIEQINFKTEDEAKAAKAAIDGGKSFEALAAERKLKDADFKLGDVTKTDLGFNKDGADAAFALPAGGTSAPVKGPFGWVLMHVVKITPGSAKSNDDVKRTLQRKLAWGRVQDMMNAYGEEIDNGSSMAVAAKKAHLNFIHIPAVDAKGNDPDGKKVLPSDSEALLGAIAKAEIGDEGDTFPTPDLHYFAIRVNGVTPPRLKNFDTVRADALKAWTADKRLALLKAKAQALTAKANKEHSLAAAAAAAAAPVQSSPALKRQTDEGLFKANVVTAIFAAKPGGAVSAPIEGGGIMIARVTGIAHPPPTPGDMQFLQGAQEISRSIGSDLLRLLAKAVQAKQGFTVNQRLIDQTVSGSGGQ